VYRSVLAVVHQPLRQQRAGSKNYSQKCQSRNGDRCSLLTRRQHIPFANARSVSIPSSSRRFAANFAESLAKAAICQCGSVDRVRNLPARSPATSSANPPQCERPGPRLHEQQHTAQTWDYARRPASKTIDSDVPIESVLCNQAPPHQNRKQRHTTPSKGEGMQPARVAVTLSPENHLRVGRQNVSREETDVRRRSKIAGPAKSAMATCQRRLARGFFATSKSRPTLSLPEARRRGHLPVATNSFLQLSRPPEKSLFRRGLRLSRFEMTLGPAQARRFDLTAQSVTGPRVAAFGPIPRISTDLLGSGVGEVKTAI